MSEVIKMDEIYYSYGKDTCGKTYYYVRVNGMMYAKGDKLDDLSIVLNSIKNVFNFRGKEFKLLTD